MFSSYELYDGRKVDIKSDVLSVLEECIKELEEKTDALLEEKITKENAYEKLHNGVFFVVEKIFYSKDFQKSHDNASKINYAYITEITMPFETLNLIGMARAYSSLQEASPDQKKSLETSGKYFKDFAILQMALIDETANPQKDTAYTSKMYDVFKDLKGEFIAQNYSQRKHEQEETMKAVRSQLP